ncbi:MAG: SDR family NAD(P)-dependent oxidoreductase [Spongiibacteraceae bacterium]
MSDLLNRLFSVQGKIALVTGGTSGIGLMIARGLVEAGVRTYIVARNQKLAEEVASELSEKGYCKAIVSDLKTVDGVNAIVAKFAEQETQLDILVNNAGVLHEGPIEEFTEDLWNETFDINLKPAFFLTQKMLPYLRASATQENPARVINISSADGTMAASREYYAYAATKAGVNHITRALAKHLAKDFINVNAIAPGLFPSSMTARFPKEAQEMAASMIPRLRFGSEEDIVGSVLYLSSRAGAYVTAAVVAVDGGVAGCA